MHIPSFLESIFGNTAGRTPDQERKKRIQRRLASEKIQIAGARITVGTLSENIKEFSRDDPESFLEQWETKHERRERESTIADFFREGEPVFDTEDAEVLARRAQLIDEDIRAARSELGYKPQEPLPKEPA